MNIPFSIYRAVMDRGEYNYTTKLWELPGYCIRGVPKEDETYRCCDSVFCAVVDDHLNQVGIKISKTDNPSLPFMGPDGCVVPPELRPFCSTYVCPDRLKGDRKFRREYQRIRAKIEADPESPRFPRLEDQK